MYYIQIKGYPKGKTAAIMEVIDLNERKKRLCQGSNKYPYNTGYNSGTATYENGRILVSGDYPRSDQYYNYEMQMIFYHRITILKQAFALFVAMHPSLTHLQTFHISRNNIPNSNRYICLVYI